MQDKVLLPYSKTPKMLPTISPWTKFFYFSHIFGILAALGYVLSAYFVEAAEKSTIGDFELHITHTLALIYYITSGFIVLTSIIGFLAQKLVNKPSLWILYCMLMSILSVVELALAGSTLSKVENHKTTRQVMRIQMEGYVKEDSEIGKRWDKMQKQYKCCGVESYTEWQDVPFGRTSLRTPKSCCLPPNDGDLYCSLNVLPEHDEADKIVYTRGCLNVIIESVDTHLTIAGLFVLTIAFLHVTFATLTCFLVITKKV